MLETVRKPNTYYTLYALINQTELTIDVYDYYWTSYSRGSDGNGNSNNLYLDGYKQKRAKSVFDPCPYGFRMPTNGTWATVDTSYTKWVQWSFVGGITWPVNGQISWFAANGLREAGIGILTWNGHGIFHLSATPFNVSQGYAMAYRYGYNMFDRNYSTARGRGHSLRCIEDSMTLIFYINKKGHDNLP